VLLAPGGEASIVDLVYRRRLLRRGPRVVAIGGGTGLSTLLRGLKEYTANITAIVTVADDGGSSGRLRRELGVLPPGDFRNCLAALADAEPLMARLLQYRFPSGSGLEGHSFGNLFIVAMTEITGNFERALRETSRVLAVRGHILPSTLTNVTLCAATNDGEIIRGESKIGHLRRDIRRVYLEPEAQAYPEAIRAILQADLIVMGPGSLYTSVLPNLLVEGIQRAIRASSALRVYVCNVATQPGETEGYSVQDHVDGLIRHAGPGLFDYVLANSRPLTNRLPETVQPVTMADRDLPGINVVLADVIADDNNVRHDPKKLADSLMRLYYDRVPERSTVRSVVDANSSDPVQV
jgi:uncharacterized cofD-like protein